MAGRILFADDNPAVRNALRQLLSGSSEGWEVYEAVDGREAIARALELRPDAIILDLAMPEVDGLTAAREISKALPLTPILLYTMHWSRQLEAESKAYGVSQVFSKADGGLLPEVIRQLLADPKRAATPAAAAEPVSNVTPLIANADASDEGVPEDKPDFPQRRCS